MSVFKIFWKTNCWKGWLNKLEMQLVRNWIFPEVFWILQLGNLNWSLSVISWIFNHFNQKSCLCLRISCKHFKFFSTNCWAVYFLAQGPAVLLFFNQEISKCLTEPSCLWWLPSCIIAVLLVALRGSWTQFQKKNIPWQFAFSRYFQRSVIFFLISAFAIPVVLCFQSDGCSQ